MRRWTLQLQVSQLHRRPELTRRATVCVGLFILSATAVVAPRLTAEEVQAADTRPMSAELRSSFGNIVVRGGTATAGQFVTGTYEKDIMDMGEGVAAGKELGTIGKDIGGVPIYFPIRIISVPAQILGGLAGKTQEEIQKFRDRLTRDLIEAQDRPMSNEALADDVFWRVRQVPGIKVKVLANDKPMPADTDAVLYVSLDSVQMTVEDTVAVITTTATVTLRRVSDGEHVFEQQVVYQDRDELKDWIKNDDAAWHSYAAYARHYVGREIAARLFERVGKWQSLQPLRSPDIKAVKKDPWRGTSKSAMPTLVWENQLLDSTVDAAGVSYELEIYNSQQLVYAARNVTGNQFRPPFELDRCQTYHWSVRPSYRDGNGVRHGEWMRREQGEGTGGGSDGLKASRAPAYLYDFAALEVRCR